MAKLITVFWRDIPAQIIAKAGRDSVKVKLSERFADAIDRAAMRAGKGSSDAYLADWKRVSQPCGADLRAAAQAAADQFEQNYDKERLLTLIRNKGDDPAADSAATPVADSAAAPAADSTVAPVVDSVADSAAAESTDDPATPPAS